MPPYIPEKYSLLYALENIGDYFWRLYRTDLGRLAKNRERSDISETIHREWYTATKCSPNGTQIRIDWAMAIYDHGDWETALRTPVPPYKKGTNQIVKTDSRQRYPAEYRCDNGIYVRSLSELCIANWLYANRIPFEYERKVFFPATNEYAHCDFYLPDQDVYIEFWGLSDDKNYEHYKRWKENNYAHNSIPLISFYPSDLKNFRDQFDSAINLVGKDSQRQ